MGAIREGLVGVELRGRFQVLPGRPVTVLDVAHNPQAAAALADSLGSMGFHPQTWAVFGIMSDKDIDSVIAALLPRVDHWYIAWSDGVTDAELNETVRFTFVGGGEGAMTRGEILLHVVTHTTYHRGFVANLFYQIPAQPPTTDLPVFLRDVPPKI